MKSDREQHMERYPDDFEDYDPDDWETEDEFESFDCAMDRHGYCGKAGSEECEFECPYNRMHGIKN